MEFDMKKNFNGIIGAAVLLAGIGGGCCNSSIQTELSQTRKQLERYYTGTQSEMTMLSDFQLAIAQMELAHVRYTICNQTGYGKIEAAFQKDEQAWEKRFKEEMNRSSDFAGGSAAPMKNNRRLTAFVVKRIVELKEKWCLK